MSNPRRRPQSPPDAATPEQQFVRFRDHGDLEALAAVFDLLAPRLLLVAGHLMHDGGLAEDLVQTTFVEAMRSARRYDARRPLLPWLVTILTHHARKLQRRRRLPSPPAANGLLRPPLAEVLDREAMAAVQAGLHALPVGYQQVLTLRLVHDLSPAAIAHALGLSPDTVKTRLRRGLDRLRKLLPPELGAALVAALLLGRGLSAMRDALLVAGARSAGALPPAAVSLGLFSLLGFSMKQLLLWTTALAVVVCLLPSTRRWLWAGPEAAIADGSVLPASAGVSASERGVIVTAPDRSAVATTPLAPPPGGLLCRGSCLGAEDRVPVAGATIELWAGASAGAGAPRHAAVSGSDGCFTLVADTLPASAFTLVIAAPGRVALQGSFETPADGICDVGELGLMAGVQVVTEVVDCHGAAVPGATVFLHPVLATKTCDLMVQRYWYEGRADAAGRVCWPTALAAGFYETGFDVPNLPRPRQLPAVFVPPDGVSFTHRLVWPGEDVRHAIAGVVLDGEGIAVADLELVALGGGTRGYARTDEHGHFLMPRIGPYDADDRGPVEFLAADADSGQLVVPAAEIRWGDRDVRLQARAAATLLVRATRADTGEVVRAFEVACARRPRADYERPRAMWQANRFQRQPDGAVQLRLPAEPHFLQVVPTDPALAPSLVVDWLPGQGAVEVALSPTRSLTVRVVDGAGRPVAGSEVWSLQPIEAVAGVPPRSGFTSVPLPYYQELATAPGLRWARAGVDDAPLGRGITDGDGCVRLPAPTATDVVLAAFGPGHEPAAVVGPSSADGAVSIAVERGASLRVQIGPPELRALWAARVRPVKRHHGYPEAQLALVRSGDDFDTEVAVAEIDAAGACVFTGLAAGSYKLVLSGTRVPGGDLAAVYRRPVGDIVLGDDTELSHVLDLASLRPGRLRGIVRLDGAPASLLPLQFVHEQHGCMEHWPAVADVGGRFEVALLPGRYRLVLPQACAADEGGGRMDWHTDIVWEVGADTDSQRTLELQRLQAAIRVIDGTGQPVPGLLLALAGDHQSGRTWRTDAEGRIVIQPAPAVPFDLQMLSGEHGVAGDRAATPWLPTRGDFGSLPRDLLGTFLIPAGQSEARFTAQLPTSRR